MVEQRSPKPSVACSSRVSPAKRSPLGLLFFVSVSRVEHATQSRRNYIPYACGCILHDALQILFARFVILVALRFHESRLPCQEKSFGTSFFCQRFASRTRNAIATELHSVRLWLHLTRRFANTICSLCYFSRFALSRVASPLPREVLWDFFFLSAFRESNTQRNRDGTTFRTLVVASYTTLCKYYLLALLF